MALVEWVMPVKNMEGVCSDRVNTVFYVDMMGLGDS